MKRRKGPPPEGGLFGGRALRDEGVDRVLTAEDRYHARWRIDAELAVRYLAGTGREFNADDVRQIAGSPVRPNAMGGVFLWAVRIALVERIGYRQAGRSAAHARRTAIYRGRVCPTCDGHGWRAIAVNGYGVAVGYEECPTCRKS